MVDLDRLERVLIRAARQEQALTYGRVLSYFGRTLTRGNVNALCRDLGKVCERVEGRGGPELACLVVRKSDRLPGAGYFVGMQTQALYRGPEIGPEAEAFIRAQQAAASAWARALQPEAADGLVDLEDLGLVG